MEKRNMKHMKHKETGTFINLDCNISIFFTCPLPSLSPLKTKLYKFWLRIFQDIVMINDYSEVYGIAYDFKGHPVMDVNPCLPDTLFSFYLFGMQ